VMSKISPFSDSSYNVLDGVIRKMGDKPYSGVSFYEYKLEGVMERFNVDSYTFNWDRWGCYVDFRYKGELYRIEHSVEKARSRGVELRSGSESFIEVVRTLEDLSEIIDRGIYGLETWLRGIRRLPGSFEVPQYFKILGFAEIPEGPEDVRQRYQTLTSQLPSDGKEKDVKLEQLKNAAEDALHYFRENRSNLQ
jgi:hypothetical protein